MKPPKTFPLGPYLLLTCCLAASFFVLAYPLYVIRPFRYQGPRELHAALTILRVRPYLQIAFAVLGLILLAWCWQRSRRALSRVLASLMTLAIVGFGLLSRVNVYEALMFRPFDNPVFAAASTTKLDGKEQVIAVKVKNEARAYPIRQISYHHVINDFLAGLPILATY
jgi:hypothetical protein